MLRWLLIHTSTPWRINAAAMSAWMSENPMTKSGCSFRISPIFALVKAREIYGQGGYFLPPSLPSSPPPLMDS